MADPTLQPVLDPAAQRFVVLTGCSGSGKSTLLDALAERGHTVVPEAGRQIVRAELAAGGSAFPWLDMEAFAALTARLAIRQYDDADASGSPVLFDRSMVDVASHLELHGVTIPGFLAEAIATRPHQRRVLMSPPWQAIYVDDGERGKDFATACAEYDGLVETYSRLGHELVELPRASVTDRVTFVEAMLDGIARVTPRSAPRGG